MRESEFFDRELRAIRAALSDIQSAGAPLSQAAIDLIRTLDEKERAAFNAKMKEKKQ